MGWGGGGQDRKGNNEFSTLKHQKMLKNQMNLIFGCFKNKI